jgi:hypothetical protein
MLKNSAGFGSLAERKSSAGLKRSRLHANGFRMIRPFMVRESSVFRVTSGKPHSRAVGAIKASGSRMRCYWRSVIVRCATGSWSGIPENFRDISGLLS